MTWHHYSTSLVWLCCNYYGCFDISDGEVHHYLEDLGSNPTKKDIIIVNKDKHKGLVMFLFVSYIHMYVCINHILYIKVISTKPHYKINTGDKNKSIIIKVNIVYSKKPEKHTSRIHCTTFDIHLTDITEKLHTVVWFKCKIN